MMFRDVFVIFSEGFAVRDGKKLTGKPHYIYIYWGAA